MDPWNWRPGDPPPPPAPPHAAQRAQIIHGPHGWPGPAGQPGLPAYPAHYMGAEAGAPMTAAYGMPGAQHPAVGVGYGGFAHEQQACLLYTSPSPRDATLSRMPSSA